MQNNTHMQESELIMEYVLNMRNRDIIVVKRNGDHVNYDLDKIRHAIRQCFKRCHVRYHADLLEKIDIEIKRTIALNMVEYSAYPPYPEEVRTIKVEDIQDIVEKTLMDSQPECAKEYILYRNHREQVRSWVDTKEDFICRYKEASNTANATIDDNSNVASRNIGVLNTEIHKEDNIQISRRMVVRKLRRIFPDFDAKQYERDLADHIIYKHDESSFAGAVAPYTYSAKEVVRVRYNDILLLIPFDMLYDIVAEPEVMVDTTNIVFQKHPDDLYVADRNENWTRVTAITKKKRHRDLYRIKTSFGEDIVVTDNHPLITNIDNIEDTTPAVNSLGKNQYKEYQKLKFKGDNIIDLAEILNDAEIYDSFVRYDRHELKRFIKLTEEFGYVIGFFIGDGNYNNNTGYLNFTQKDQSILHKINNILFDTTSKAGVVRYHSDRNIYTLEVRSRGLFKLLKNFFGIQDKAQGKTLPINILEFNEDFAKGIVEGIYDADGTANYNQLWLKLASRAAILQVAELMRYFGYSVGNGIQSVPFENTGYKTNYSLWTIGCSRREESIPMDMSFKWKNVGISKSTPKYKINGEVKITNVQKIESNDSFLFQNEFIYDITTETHTFILNNIVVHNCVALTMYPFLDGGIKGIGGLSAKPKNLDSYCGMLCNMIFAISAQFAGACLYKDQPLIIRENGMIKSISIKDLISKYELKYQLHNSEGDWEVAEVNDGTLEVWEDGKFVNITKVYRRNYSDKIYKITTYGGKVVTTSKDHRFKVRFKDRDFEVRAEDLKCNDTLYRTDKVSPRNLDSIKSIEIIDNDDQYVYEIETTSHWYSASDILTHNCAVPEALLYFDYFARKEWGDDYYLHTDDIVNPRSKHPRTIGQQIHQYFQQVIYSINQPAAARGLQSAFVNFSYYDKAFYEGMFGNFVFPDFTQPIWESFNWLQKDFMQWFNEERKRCVLTFPVESFAMVYQDHKFLDPESADFVAEEYARGHSFFTYISDTVDSLSSCCRLKNKLQTKEFNFTNGNMGLQTGSKSVITINLNRIIQDCDRAYGLSRNGGWMENTSFIVQYLGDILDRVYKYHTAYNELLWDMKDAHLLPVYDAGFIDLNKQYLTIGINGLNQAAEFLGMKCNDNPEYKKFCQTIFGAIAEKNKEAGKEKFNGHTLTFNTEQVPAESLAIKNYNWDKEDDYWVPEDTNLYASYIFKPNDPTTDIFEKLRLHGREYIGDYLDGGSAAHINLEEHLTKDQYKNVIKYAAEQGTNYFTFNIPMTECCDCGHIVNGPVEECPVCHSHNLKYWTRIIGYLTAVKSWSAGRQEEFKTRIFHTLDKNKYTNMK